MGLAGTKIKQRFGTDPRNTKWSNDDSRFGHQYLQKMGWEPGKGLGLAEHAMTTHIKVSTKDDNLGLGAKLAKKRRNDKLDDGECKGLDIFQRILGRLNGKEEQINKELERKRQEVIIEGKWGIRFVKGETLKSSWNSQAGKRLNERKRKLDSPDLDESEAPKKKKRTKEIEKKKKKKKKREKKEKKENHENKKKGKKDKKETKDKKDKEEKKEKKDEKEKNGKKVKKESKDRKEKMDKYEKKDKRTRLQDIDIEKSRKQGKKKTYGLSDDNSNLNMSEIESDSLASSAIDSFQKDQSPANGSISKRLSARSKYIRQKKASVMDAKALNEIFMITN